MTSRPRLVLASASPARLKTLRAAGIEADVIVSGVDESTVDCSRADVLSLPLARLKAQAVAAGLGGARRPPARRATPGDAQPEGPGPGDNQPVERTLVLGCDSVLDFDGEILGKPRDAAEATTRWRRMRGRSGVLYTGHCLIDLESGKRGEAVAATTVHFGDVSDEEIAAYVHSGEPMRVAGGFTIDGLGGPFVESIEGDPGNVIGLSLPLLRRMLAEHGLRVSRLWQPPR